MEKQMFVNDSNAKARIALLSGKVKALKLSTTVIEVVLKQLDDMLKNFGSKNHADLTREQATALAATASSGVMFIYQKLHEEFAQVHRQEFEEIEKVYPELEPYTYRVHIDMSKDIPLIRLYDIEKP